MEKLSYIDIVNRMIDMKKLAEVPPQGEKCAESSAYNKKSLYNQTTGHYENWGENDDWGYDAPRTEDGGYLLADLKGPGAIVRIWSADPREGHIKIFIDEKPEPAIDMPFLSLFGPGESPFNLPELCYEAARGKNCYIPIPYHRSCKVIVYDDWGMYYQINHISFSNNTAVESFELPLTLQQQSALNTINRAFSSDIGNAVKSIENAATESGKITIFPGETADIFNREGPGAVAYLRVKIEGLKSPEEEWDALSALTISAFWDGEQRPSVWTTLGGFFGSITGLNPYKSLPLGVNKDGTMYSNWYMPFDSGSKISITNEGGTSYEISCQIKFVPLEKKDALKLLRFHAKWNRAKDPEQGERWPDSQFLFTRGTGRFVGTSLHVYKEKGTGDPSFHPEWWWGEGDEKFFVDGEKFPSWFGTGCEDYFGYAWGSPEFFSRPYHSQPFTNGGMFGIGNRLNNRFHILDSVPFSSAFDANLEKYHRDPYVNWVFTNYWYLEKGGIDPYGAVPLEKRTEYYRKPYPAPATFYEGEELIIIGAAGTTQAETQDMRESGPFWSKNEQLIFKANTINSEIKFRVNIPEDGVFRVFAAFTKAEDFGLIQHSIDNNAVGETIDLYNGSITHSGEVYLGRLFLPKGYHELKAKVLDKNRLSKGYFYGLDYMKFDKQ